MSASFSASLVIVVANQAEVLDVYLSEFYDVIPEWLSLFVLDNGSLEDQQRELVTVMGKFPRIKVVSVTRNRGLGFAVLVGLKECTGHSIAWMTLNPAVSLAEVIRLITDHLNENPDGITQPFLRKNPFKWLTTITLSVIQSILFRRLLWDTGVPLMILPKSLFLSWKNPPHTPAISIFAHQSAKALGLTIRRTNIELRKSVTFGDYWSEGPWEFTKLVSASLDLWRESRWRKRKLRAEV